MIEDVHALQAVGRQAGGGILAFPQVQAGGDVGRHRQAKRDDQRILDEVRFGIGKGSVPGVKVGSDGLGYLINSSKLYYKTSWAFAGIVTLAVIGFAADRILQFIGKRKLKHFDVK